ncbi:CHASE2 domain-containing protein [Oscillatoria sp. FACHB-1406]|uniref:CHASE2 domain-containing protein n=1 Tax=Oscillatoria sp. FACHB-1406 TaxID=2692846 RepID=UPI001685A05E|nr:CHASE2 domain-containing protein [Oscillatoria sp. FACHB-1406]MBD2578908.1 CHASE2 domain-containing protein [Oscillatoria sp. FACHB-1406]
MLHRIVIINLGCGNLQQGFSTVIAQISIGGQGTGVQISGSLPPAPEIAETYSRWHKLYRALSTRLRGDKLRASLRSDIEFEEEEDYIANVSQSEFDELCGQLEKQLNRWLNSESFHRIDRQLRTQLLPTEEIQVAIEVEDEPLRHLPWHLWHFFEDYPKAEVTLSPQEYERVVPVPSQGRILAILGHASGIDVQADRALLESLPGAEVVFLVEPTREILDRWLWDDRGWDILFFAGHSASEREGEVGWIEINPTEGLRLDRLKNALRAAISRGLKLAIFNSCDGLGLARQLADLNLPQLIVMREPVPDRVAQAFLKNFLAAFARGESFPLAVREARERLQGLESEFPCASWLPAIFQNPTTVPPVWPDFFPVILPKKTVKRSRVPLSIASLGSLGAAAFAISLRLFGVLQPLELKAFDALLRLRPEEGADPRLLLVTVTARDVQEQRGRDIKFARSGRSLSDRSLAQLLDKLKANGARVVGLDIYRDFAAEPESRNLIQNLQNDDRLVVVCKAGNGSSSDFPPAPEIPPQQVGERAGFGDIVADSEIDGVLRRQLFGMSPPVDSRCRSSASLALQVALRYLKDRGIEATLTNKDELSIGNALLKPLGITSGGYRNIDVRGYQIMLNYRATQQIAPQLTLASALAGGLTPELAKGRIVLIGTTDESFGDVHRTPYDRAKTDKTPGVVIQAQAVSQIISASLDKRPLIWFFPEWGEMLWIVVWSGVGGGIVSNLYGGRARLGAGGGAIAILIGGCYLVLWRSGGWLPVVPAALGAMVAMGTVAIVRRLRPDGIIRNS